MFKAVKAKRETNYLASVPENLLYKFAGDKFVSVFKKTGLFTKEILTNSSEPGNLPYK